MFTAVGVIVIMDTIDLIRQDNFIGIIFACVFIFVREFIRTKTNGLY